MSVSLYPAVILLLNISILKNAEWFLVWNAPNLMSHIVTNTVSKQLAQNFGTTKLIIL